MKRALFRAAYRGGDGKVVISNMIELDPKSRLSIYEQVVDKVRMLIASGVIAPNEKLQSVRDMSKLLTINPNTVQKAFRELEHQGYIYTVSGVGSFAADPADIRPDEKLIAAARLKLADEIRELRSLTGSAVQTRDIVMDIVAHIENSFGNAAAGAKGV
jgi:GntR family transcriptional regulator